MAKWLPKKFSDEMTAKGFLAASSLAHFCESAGVMAILHTSSLMGRPGLPALMSAPMPPSSSLMYLTAASAARVYSGNVPAGSPSGFWKPMTTGSPVAFSGLAFAAASISATALAPTCSVPEAAAVVAVPPAVVAVLPAAVVAAAAAVVAAPAVVAVAAAVVAAESPPLLLPHAAPTSARPVASATKRREIRTSSFPLYLTRGRVGRPAVPPWATRAEI